MEKKLSIELGRSLSEIEKATRNAPHNFYTF